MKDDGGPARNADVDLDVARGAGPRVGAAELFRRHAGFVARFLAQLGVRPQEIDDAVQEVFLAAHRRGGYLEGPARPTTWLAEIALRVVQTRRRTARRRPEGPGEVDASDEAIAPSGPFEAMVEAEARARVARALDALDLEHRAVFVLFELDGEPCDAIAASLGVPVGTVYSRLHKARQRFKDAYERQEREPFVRARPRAAGDRP
jgi:RNA polymerase sigma-70 factor, ECF subfamily